MNDQLTDNVSIQQNGTIDKPAVISRLFHWIRRAWCYKYTYWNECSSFTPGARWCNGGEYYEHEIGLFIPLWIRGEDDVSEYYDRWGECGWLYFDAT